MPLAACHRVPDGVPPEAALFLPQVETALNLVMDGAPLIGERVLVFGQGVVGLLTAALAGGISAGAPGCRRTAGVAARTGETVGHTRKRSIQPMRTCGRPCWPA